ncbi:MAG: alanine racemase [Bacilli bacterium]|nr:alanine racemase [Bacilli bacterium]
MDYSEIIEKYKTPFYIYDIDVLNERIKFLRNRINNDVKLCYAMKANPFIISYLPNLIDRIEVCSPGEYEICKKNKISEEKLVISGVNKEEKEIKEIITNLNKEIITIESINQFELILSLAKHAKKKVKVLIRLTSGNQFGVSESELFMIIKRSLENTFIEVRGLEYFSGTQKHSIKKLTKEFDYLKEIISSVSKEFNFEIQELEYGTGFPVFYFEDSNFDEEEFLSAFNILLTNFKNTHITLEIGRSIAASCGSYWTSVVDMKKNETGNYCILDGGIHQLVYYGSTLAMKIPFYEVTPKRENGDKEKWTLCGSLCSVNDVIAKNIEISNLKVGDTLIFKNTGAYSATEGIALFLSRDLPKIIIKKKNEIKVLRDRIETYQFNTGK